jgi:diguanylate cyclase (GGDEF)-like protein
VSESNLKRVAIIADDEDLGRILLAEAVSACGLHALSYESGDQALQAALVREVAIVLLDVDMPGMDGYAVCRRLRADHRFDSVPIVMVTGHDDASAISRAFEAGATDFITKPVNWALLPRRLAYILRNAAAAERIEKLAYFDSLTGLPNRSRCLERAELMIELAKRDAEQFAILYMDLNGFKKVNDTFGHAIGDAVLREVAVKLGAVLQSKRAQYPHTLLARFGGDEFVIILRHADARAAAIHIADSCAQCLKSPITTQGLEFFISPSIGVAVHPDDGAEVTTVLKHADAAMFQSKAALAGSIVSYTAAMGARLHDWLSLDGRLRRALREDALTLHYQPKFNVRDRSIVGVEALLRWHDPEQGDIPATRFIEIAEDSGLIIELGAWVVRNACQQLKAWQAKGINMPIAVNVSGKELLYGDPARIVESEAAAAGVDTSLIEIEITESLLIKDSSLVRTALKRLRTLGCKIALDDFGTGYSSLAYITKFPPDRIKIDKVFVNNLDRSASDAAVAAAILSLGESLNVAVTAEGVERQSQLEWLKRRGCQEIQGYLLSMPLSAAHLEAKFLSKGGQEEDQTYKRILSA